ncbi:MAG: type II secretion system protein [Verrucomicrobiales bacterium]
MKRTQSEACGGVRGGFSLVEILVVIAIVAALLAVSGGVFRSASLQAKQAKCLGNLRQIGTAALSYALDHQGRYPQATHQLDAASCERGWINSLATYLDEVDEVRLCPVDPKAEERLRARGTSYVLNSFLTVEATDPFGQPLENQFTRMHQVPDQGRTPLAFIINFDKGAGFTNDHTHSAAWTSWSAVLNDIEVDAFRVGGRSAGRTQGSSNYLFADGHAETLKASVVSGWIRSGYNFADPAALPQN